MKSTTSESKEQNDKLNTEIQELNNMLTITQDEKADLKSLLVELNNTLLQKDTKIQEFSELLGEKENLIGAQKSHIEELESDLDELKPPMEEKSSYSYETRIICPMCQAVGKDIREVEDKKTILYYRGGIPIYAKKYVCKKCGYEWN